MQKRPDGTKEMFCRFEKKLKVRVKLGEDPGGNKRSMSTHLYDVATAKKGDEVPECVRISNCVRRWRLYI